jgi:membrane protease YdiL (CAAX protease family)
VNSPAALSTARAIWIIGRLAIRRQLNLWQSVRFARKRKRAQAKRAGTPGKSGGRSFFGSFVFLLMLTNGFLVGSRGLTSLSATSQNIAESTDKIVVSAYTHVKLVEADSALRHLYRFADLAERKRYQGMWNRFVDQLLVAETRWGSFSEDEETVRLRQMHQVFAQKGAAGFSRAHGLTLSVSATTWPRMGVAKSTFLGALSLLVTLWIPIIVFISLGTNNKDLGQVEWSFEWLYTFPVSARALFASKIFVYSFLNPLPWGFFFPFIILIYVASGYGLAALALGFAVMVYLALIAGAITSVVEVVLRKFLSLGQLKNVQALFTVLGTVALLLFYSAALSRPVDDFLVHRAASMPALLIWNPFSLPLILAMPAAPAWQLRLGVIGMIAGTVAVGSLALIGSEWLTQDGLIKAGGPYQSARQQPAATAWRRSVLRGIAAQEMRLLARDRNLLAQVLIIPLLVPAYYLLTNSGMISAITGNFRRAAMVAFAVGAYSFFNSALMLLSREDKTLWHLLSFPQSLASVLLKKTAVWAVVGALYGGTVLFVLAHSNPLLHTRSAGDVFLTLYGIVLYAFIASGIGILATDVLEPERSARIRIDMVYLYMVLAAMYANAFYTLSLWSIAAQLVLTTLLAVALWQKVKDLAPYLLDPTERPPRTIGLADGMIAALAFFFVQGMAVMLFQGSSTTSLAVQVTIAYIVAGLIVACAVLCILWRQGVHDLWRKIGFVPGANEGRRLAPIQGVMQGAIWGAAAALGAFVYLHALGLFPQWQVWLQDAELSSFLSRADQPLWICLLLVLAAPLVEEFLFRGLVFQGLRRSTGPLLAILGSAALFALVHPPIAVIPVFGLGIATAISFERSRFLLAPVVAHAVYNGLVLFFNNL